MDKKTKYDGDNNNRGNSNSLDEHIIIDSVKWSITEYSLFVSKLVKKGLSLNTDKNLGKGWFCGVCVDYRGVLNFTDPFTLENKPYNNELIGAVGSFNLNDSEEYYVIPETDNKFVEILDYRGEIDPDFPLRDYSLRLNHSSSDSQIPSINSKVSIRKYDVAVSNFIRKEMQKGSLLDLFQIYIQEKIDRLKNLNK